MKDYCPKCHRPINDGNSQNLKECHARENDDDDFQCELSAKIHDLMQKVDVLAIRATRAEAERDELTARMIFGASDAIRAERDVTDEFK